MVLHNRDGRVVDCGREQNIWIPVELCTVGAGQPFRDQLDPDQTANMIRVACTKPENNAHLITSEGTRLLAIDDVTKGPVGSFGFPSA